MVGSSMPPRKFPTVEKAVVLRGEDFPSLQAATLPAASGPGQKQKDVTQQKLYRKVNEDALEETMASDSYLRPSLQLGLQQNLSSRASSRDVKGGVNGGNFGGSFTNGQSSKKNDPFPSPLPLVRLNHTSDWADDERDVGHAVPDREKDHGSLRSESPWSRDFDAPRGSAALPRSSLLGLSDGWKRDEEAARPSSRDIARSNVYSRDGRVPSRESRDGNSWKPASSFAKDGTSAWDAEFDRPGASAKSLNLNEDASRERRNNQFFSGDGGWDNFRSGVNGSQESRFGRSNTIYGHGYRQNGNHMVESFNGRGAEQNKLDHSNRYRGDFFQNNFAPKASYSHGGKGNAVNDPILNFGRERRSTNGKQHLEDPFLKDFSSGSGFDGRDPLSGGLAGVIKKKKDVLKQTDFHDPVRESFEAELDRVQKMQEQERQRAIEEQARALELARKEEEERERLAREEEEQRRRLEEEARETAWRAEQEHLEAVRLAEEQRIAREEEKQGMLLEEERRKEAARKKLLELEARMARRQAEGTKSENFSALSGDERIMGTVKDKDVPRVAEVVDWEDGERMVERITSSASSDSSGLNRSFEVAGSRPQYYRNGDYAFPDRKHTNSWKRDVFENGSTRSSSFHLQDHENGYRSPRRDAIGSGRAFNRREFYGSPGVSPARIYSEPHVVDDFPNQRGHRWNFPGDMDHYNRNSEIDPEYSDNLAEKFNDVGWVSGRSRTNPYAPYPERPYQNPEMDGFSSFGRSRYSMRQPRVLPPPSLASMHKSNFKTETDHPHSAFLNGEMNYHPSPRRNESDIQTAYDDNFQEHEQSRMMDVQQNNTIHQVQKEDETTAARCDSQSSLSVSSAPSSPTHLSHDDLEDSGYSPVSVPPAEDKEVPVADDINVTDAGKVGALSSGSPLEDEEWAIEDNQDLPEQEEYDEEENGYREEDELHEVDDGRIDLPREFEDLHLEETDSSGKVCQVVLGFNEGVEVGISNSDDFERLSANGEDMAGTQQCNVLEDAGSFEGFVEVVQSHNSENISSEIGVEAFKSVQETDKPLANLVLQNMGVPHSFSAASSGYFLEGIESSSSSRPLSQQLLPPATSDLTSSLGQRVTTSVSNGPVQTETPVNLQFGLFSGPSLLPSPVPAIQIGSIQMPLHLHPPVGPPVTQLHPSPPPFFQFGQVRYASPISQGILPLAPQSMSFVAPSVPVHYPLNQNHEGFVHSQTGRDISSEGMLLKNNVSSIQVDNQPVLPRIDQSEDRHEQNTLKIGQGGDSDAMRFRSKDQHSLIGETRISSGLISQAEGRGHRHLDEKKNPRTIVVNDESQGSLKTELPTSRFSSKAPGTFAAGNKGKRYIYTVKKSGSKPSHPVSGSPNAEFTGYQGKPRQKFRPNEFRVRENFDKRPTEGLVSSNAGPVEKSNFSGRGHAKSSQVVRKDVASDRTSKQMIESDGLKSDLISSNGVKSEVTEKQLGKEVPSKSSTSIVNISHSGVVSKTNYNSEEDVDAPLQSGVVRVFKQSGIEIPSDEDDFIEVRSKRQMLNDRREQREKEIKAKSRVIKAPRKRHSISQNIVESTNSSKSLTSLGGELSNSFHSKPAATEGRDSLNDELSTGFTNVVVSQPLAPIGTPAVTVAATDKRSQARRSRHTGFVPAMNSSIGNHLPGSLLESKNVVLDNVSPPLSHWVNLQSNQQVMALTQSQFDEAMKPARFDSLGASIGDHSSVVIDSNKSSTSIMAQDKSLSSSSSPLNSLLAGETIQFGAVTSPPILPSSSHVISKALGPPGSGRSDSSVDHKLSSIESDCALFFEKAKHPNESCVHLEDPEAEAQAEAAASAVAVAAITTDEIVGNGLGVTVSVSDTKSFVGGENGLHSEGQAIIAAILSSGIGSNQLACQSRAEESLSVALPADLSVEMPALSLWPPLPSPQNSSGPMLSHFPGAPPSHFPCYDMNPMLGAPIFAFSPHDESAGTQSQAQESRSSSSGQLGAWPQCHSGIDSFYGPSAGFTGPFISPSGGIPGVQGPPHMVVYNHFAPVAQFGQVGLSFMGATYIPSGKQPDWKHNSASSGTGIGEGDINNLNIAPGQRNSHSMPAPVQHLAPGSPLLPLPSPLTMFDMSPFQPSPDIPVQARWPHVPASPIHSVPLSMPLQQEGGLPSQFSHASSVDQTGNMFREPHSSTPQDGGRNLNVVTDASVTQFPDELGLVDTSNVPTSRVLTSKPASYSSTVGNVRSQSIIAKSMPKSTGAIATKSGLLANSSNPMNSNQVASSALQTQSQPQNLSIQQQYIQPPAHSDHRIIGAHHKVGSGGEWSQRRIGGFHGRNQSSAQEKKLAPAKVKQVYVAKTTRTQA
ncbi:hypothetical protein Sjap_017252 [Stephania japonica]|uniref:Uncharacterized protein n=1 Tax=Stephania japonica TaxID=461633 RepID=A0AAP0NI35_9MAGN